ncbi:hypothetical protein [Streptosporangium sp. NPDC000239]|uniref:hypothetical protein n=1 Tax=unclassified Streptosporangium TaxID=2632669 RepID=UPI00332033EF
MFLPKFLHELQNRACPDKLITVITGSDGAAQPRDTPELTDPKVSTVLIYALGSFKGVEKRIPGAGGRHLRPHAPGSEVVRIASPGR